MAVSAEVARLREDHYNATVVDVRNLHDELMILRVRPDQGLSNIIAGQYITLGLGRWETRIDGIQPDAKESARSLQSLIRRAYSISCPLWNEDGRLVRCAEADFLEFYITLVHRPTDTPPALTPRLFSLQRGDRLHTGERAVGNYTLGPVDADDDVLFLATGTGEAPHNAMLAELLLRGHKGRIAAAVCVRYRKDLGYLEAHRRIEQRFSRYRYLPLTTREPENVDSGRADYIGKRYVQDVLLSSDLFEEFGWLPDPGRTHVFLCGSPAMIGLPAKDEAGDLVFPQPTAVAEVLVKRGFQLDEPRKPGNVHFEKFW